MIWFFLVAILGFGLAVFAEASNKIEGFLYGLLMFVGKAVCYVCCVLSVWSCIPSIFLPQGLEKATAYVVTDEGIIMEANEDYYKDSSGNYYLCDDSFGKLCLVPFYKSEYVKVDEPVYEREDLVYQEKETGKTQPCDVCGNELSENDNFCSECGTAIKEN